MSELGRILDELEKLIRADEAALGRQDYSAVASQQSLKSSL